MANAIFLQNITKTYHLGEIDLQVLKHIDLEIDTGEYVAIMGTSGSGKSTLMNIIGCLDRPTSGLYLLNGIDVTTLSDDELAHIRNQYIGFVFQHFHLLPKLTALENAMVPTIYADIPRLDRIERATNVLTMVGLKDFIEHQPNQLSGGQQQRVSIARALVNHPALLLADEPTGALDSKTSEEIMNLLTDLNRQGTTVAIVTHDANVAARTNRIIRMLDGVIIDSGK